jgi:hypothetical protein
VDIVVAPLLGGKLNAFDDRTSNSCLNFEDRASPLDGHIGGITLATAFGGLAMARRGSSGPIALAALTALAAPAVASAQASTQGDTLSKTQARALPPAELTHRVMDLVADLLTPSDPRPSPGRTPTKPLRDLAFQAAPRATWAPGVCARDSVVVTFEPAGPDQGADTAMRAASLKASTRYRLVAPPAREDDYYDGPPPPQAQAACGELAGQDVSFFSAPTAEAALSGAWWLTRAAEGAVAPDPTFEIDCRVATATPESCPAILRRLTVADLRSVWPCPDDRRAAETLRCWTMKVWPADKTYELKVFASRGPGAAIARIEVDEQVLTGETLTE